MFRLFLAKYSSLLVVVFLMTLLACSNSSSPGSTEIETPQEVSEPLPDIVALYRGSDLANLVIILESHACLTPPVSDALIAAVPASGSKDTSAFLEVLDSSAVCADGAQLLNDVAVSPILVLVETGRILIDSTANGCHDSMYSLQSQAITSLDADSDGCVDLLHEVDQIEGFSVLPEAVQMRLTDDALAIFRYLLPAPEEISLEPGFDPEAYRAEATVTLDGLIEWVLGEPAFGTTAGIFSSFLDNTRPFVNEWYSCSTEVTPPKQPSTSVATTETLRFYIYTNSGHAFKSLGVGQNEWKRGLYPTANSGGQAHANVPGAASAPTATPVPAPGTPGSSSSSPGASNGSSWGAEAAPSGSSVGFGLGLISYLDGMIADEADTPWSSRICWDVTPKEWDRIAEHMNGETNDAPDWSLLNHNCLSWAANNAAMIGKLLPAYTTLSIPNPGVLDTTLQGIGDGGSFKGGTVNINFGG